MKLPPGLGAGLGVAGAGGEAADRAAPGGCGAARPLPGGPGSGRHHGAGHADLGGQHDGAVKSAAFEGSMNRTLWCYLLQFLTVIISLFAAPSCNGPDRVCFTAPALSGYLSTGRARGLIFYTL